jgi:predicted transcriptional regulator
MSFESDQESLSGDEVLRLSADIAAAYFSNNAVSPSAIPEVIRSVHEAVLSLQSTPAPAPVAEKLKPAVPISKSVGEDYIVCLEDGKRLKMLKRYLRAKYNLTPEDYRRRWGLPPEYPMVAPAYAARRSDFAKQIGLGKGVRRNAG